MGNKTLSETVKGYQKQIIKNGVKNLREFGYPSVNEENILTDMVYSAIFKNSLNDNRGQSPNADVTEAIDDLIETITQNEKKEVKKPKYKKNARKQKK